MITRKDEIPNANCSMPISYKELLPNFGNMTPEEITKFLDDANRSKGYLIIRDKLTPEILSEIKKSASYQQFQVVKSECKQSWDYDHRVPMMLDINNACTNVYGIILNLLKAHKNDVDNEFSKIMTAINKIEEHIGIEQTDWSADKSSKDGDNNGNVEGIEKDI